MKIINKSLTFDDVLIIPNYSDILPSEVSIKTKFSRNIELNIPIVSAAMDTVTEASMAIAMAREGGIGVIHKNMDVLDQVKLIKKIKRSENAIIKDPIITEEDKTVGIVKELMNEYNINGIPVVDKEGALKGIITARDLRFERNDGKLVREIMTTDMVTTSMEEFDLEKAEEILKKEGIEKLPILKDNKLVGLITYKDIIKIREKPNACKDKYGRLRVAAAIGITEKDMERALSLIKAGVDALVVDTAHAHSKKVGNSVKQLIDYTTDRGFDVDIIVGNVVTAKAAKYLMDLGVDGIKIGIGPGSICTTRVIAGIGVPQLSAIMDIYDVTLGQIPLIADGGIRFSGDITKALSAGADTVMIGSLLAGTEEAPSETIIFEGRRFKSYRGMGSIEAMREGSADRYFQSSYDVGKLVAEGVVGRVPYKGTVYEVVTQFIGGLKAGMGYCGAHTLNKLKRAKFTKITNMSVRENHPHDVSIVTEAPNYSR
jgi:IMP dehydrogenase